jgi:hypothetical protein
LVNYPNGRIRDNSGSGDGTGVNRLIYGDQHEFFAKLMRLAGLVYNGLPDNEANGYQLIEALAALAGKNDLIHNLNTSAGVVTVDLKLGKLVLNEVVVCLAKFDISTETSIKGSDNATKVLTVPSNFKNGDYLRLINTSTGILLVRLADAGNIDVLASALNYLKAAANADEDTGTSVAKATTPAGNKYIFAKRVNGTDSATYLATHLQNGLMSKEDKTALDSLQNPVKNVGWFSGVDSGGGVVGSNAPVSGDITSAVITIIGPAAPGVGAETTYRITMAHAMLNTNYFVRCHLQSEGTIQTDNNCRVPVFRPVSTTQFDWSISESESGSQSIKVHLEVVQIS